MSKRTAYGIEEYLMDLVLVTKSSYWKPVNTCIFQVLKILRCFQHQIVYNLDIIKLLITDRDILNR